MRNRSSIKQWHVVPALLVASVTVLIPSYTAAQTEAEPGPLDPLKACQAEAEANARLACYDAAVGAMVAAEAQGDLRIVDAEAVRKTRRGLFGFSLPDLGIFGGGDDDDDDSEEFDSIQTTVTSVRYSTPTSFTVRIAEGNALWQISDAPRRLLSVESGDEVEIKKAALGSYFVRFNGQGGVKGRRVE